MTEPQPPGGCPRTWTWSCPICGLRLRGTILGLSAVRLDHLRTCVPAVPEEKEYSDSYHAWRMRRRRGRS